MSTSAHSLRRIGVCTHRRLDGQPSCAARGSEQLLPALRGRLAGEGRDVEVFPLGCLGDCERGPNVKIVGGELLHEVTLERLDAVRVALDE
ncbi:(2Fe-2S) ferredoxin domain-containing protein [Chitinilyticum piscinae]|uniref:(2Fe-2S) ferredoxin domain-containing protein n=1 Tax=Chitinilyticum piscinae TaxID=2866724 RepID=A0A8J7K303_9NEIS|nr:(2Fe-2S) ferredoxin domain-containing protein [Chitinilyticum piscinae]MBE9610702.1 (2Fe-2S) ferredoxin domain-containing protein [Chitinilyticum piscinae]